VIFEFTVLGIPCHGTTTGQFLKQPELAKVDFRKLPWAAFDPSDRPTWLAETAVLAGKPMQRGIRNGQSFASEQLVNLR